MNKRFLLLLVFSFSCLLGHVQGQDVPSDQGQANPEKESYTLKGKLVDTENSSSIPFAHITNLSKGIRTLSDSSGIFSIPATEGDSLQVSSVSYGYKSFNAPAKADSDQQFLIELVPNVYELDEVIVNSFPSERRFKQNLLTMEIPEEESPDIRYSGRSPVEPSAADMNPKASLGSPISAIAGKFSKKGKSRAFAAEIQDKEEKRAIIHTKYNREIVRDITGLEDDDELDAFMNHCPLADNFLSKATEYEIHKAVLDCYHEYKKQQKG